MNAEDQKTLRGELCKRWPKKFQKEDLDYWCRQLCGFMLSDVTDALTTMRNTSAFRPKIAEVIKLLPRVITAAQQKQEKVERPFSEIVAGQMGMMQPTCKPIERLMRYWRQLWWLYKTNADRSRESMDLATTLVAQREKCDVSVVRGKPAFIESVALWESQNQGALNKCLISCAACIVAEVEVMTIERAGDYAAWIETNPDQFRGFLADLRAEELAGSFT